MFYNFFTTVFYSFVVVLFYHTSQESILIILGGTEEAYHPQSFEPTCPSVRPACSRTHRTTAARTFLLHLSFLPERDSCAGAHGEWSDCRINCKMAALGSKGKTKSARRAEDSARAQSTKATTKVAPETNENGYDYKHQNGVGSVSVPKVAGVGLKFKVCMSSPKHFTRTLLLRSSALRTCVRGKAPLHECTCV